MINKNTLLISAITILIIGILSFIAISNPDTFSNITSVGPESTNSIEAVKEYNPIKKEVKFKDENNNNLVTAQLKTPLTFNVIDRGDGVMQRVAEIEFTNIDRSKELNEIFTNFEFKDMKKSGKGISRDVEYRLKVLDRIDKEPIYEEDVCWIEEGDKVCNWTQVGERDEYIYKYIPINKKSDLPNGNFTLGLFTDVRLGDSVDWIPSFYGDENKVEEWAVWTEGLNNGLELYFDGNSTTERVKGIYNLTSANGGTLVQNSTFALIGNAFQVRGNTGTDSYKLSNPDALTSMDFYGRKDNTLNMWIYIEGGQQLTTDPYPFGFDDRDGSTGETRFEVSDSGAKIRKAGDGAAVGCALTGNYCLMSTDGWYMVTYISNATGVFLYVNGTRGVNSGPTPTNGVQYDFLFGNRVQQDFGIVGAIDEIGIYNRTLTNQEILDLFNDGAGLTYDPTPGGASDTTPPVLNFINPTLNDSTTYDQFSIPVNVSFTDETAIDTMTINLYFGNHTLINSTTIFNQSPYYLNYTGLSYDSYLINATGNDTSNNIGDSVTRNITLALVPDTCQELSSSLTLSNNVSSTGQCFNIVADHVVLNCRGHTISFASSTGGGGINVTGSDNVTIRDCNIEGGAGGVVDVYGIALSGNTQDLLVVNNTINVDGANFIGAMRHFGGFSSDFSNVWVKDNTFIVNSSERGFGYAYDPNNGANTLDNFTFSNNYVQIYSREIRGLDIDSTNANGMNTSLVQGNTFNFSTYTLNALDSHGIETVKIADRGVTVRDNIIYMNMRDAAVTDAYINLNHHFSAYKGCAVNCNAWVINNTFIDIGAGQSAGMSTNQEGQGIGNSTFINNTFINFTGSIINKADHDDVWFKDTTVANRYGNFTLGEFNGNNGLDTLHFNISGNRIFVNSTLNPLMNVSATVRFNTGGTNIPLIDSEDDGSYIECTAPICTNVVSTASSISYDVSGFTTYSSGIGTAPNVTILSPLNIFYKVASIIFTIEIFDDLSISSAWYTLTGGASNVTLSQSGNNWTHTNTSIADGNYTAQFYANDSAGNLNNSESIAFTVDTTPPGITIDNIVANGSYFTDTGKNVEYTATDTNGIDSCWYSNDTMTQNITFNGCADITNVTWTQGNHDVHIWANDTLGNIGFNSISFVIDSIPPEMEFHSSAEPNGTVNQTGTFYVNYTITEANFDTGTFTLAFINGTLVNSTTRTISTYTTDITWMNLQDGNYYTNLSITDKAINTNSSTNRYFSIDTSGPVMNYVSPTETNGSEYTRNNIVVNVTAVDAVSNLDTIIINLYNRTGLVNSSSSSTSPFYINFTSLPDEYYYFNATANDSLGYSTDLITREVNISNIDSVAPTVTIATPANASLSTDNGLDVEYTATDAFAVDSCWYTKNAGATNNTLASCVNVTTETWSEGSNTVVIYANDTSGNIGSDTVTFTIDTILPDVSLVHPQNITYNYTALSLNFTTADTNGVDACWYTDDAGATNNTIASCANTTYTAAEGSTTLVLYANDTLGQINSSSVTFTVTLPVVPVNVSRHFDEFDDNSINATLFNVIKSLCDSGTGWSESGTKAFATCEHTTNNAKHAVQINATGTDWNSSTFEILIDYSMGSNPASYFRFGFAAPATDGGDHSTIIWQSDYYEETAATTKQDTLFSWVPNDTGITIYKDDVYVKSLAFNGTTLPTISMTGGGGQFTYLNLSRFYMDNKILVTSPANNSNHLSNVNFDITQIGNSVNNTQSTLYIWDLDGNLITTDTNSSISSRTDNVVWNIDTLTPGNYKWNVEACTAGFCNFERNRNLTFNVGFNLDSQINNATSYETSKEHFQINIDYNQTLWSTVAGILQYNNTNYTATVETSSSTANLSADVTIPLISGSSQVNTLKWYLQLSNSTDTLNLLVNESQQNVSSISFGFCNTSLTTPYLNFTFKNETDTEEDVSATISSSWTYYLGDGSVNKTITFSNSTENPSYAFCFTPEDRSLNVVMDVDYNNGESQQRSYQATSLVSNSTTNQVLYLLPTTLGLFSQFQTITTSGNPIQDVKGTITRTFGGSLITTNIDYTDSSGLVVFFLNPDATYTATFSKSGFPDNTFTFVPTSDTRIVTMGGGVSGISNGTQILSNTTYSIEPSNSSLVNNTLYTFSINVTSGQTITGVTMNITNGSDQLGYTSASDQGLISLSINTNNDTRIVGYYTISTSDETFTVTKIWTVGNEFVGDYSIFRQLTLFMDYSFSDFVRLILVLGVILGILIFLSAGDIVDSAENRILVGVLLVWAFSIVGWLDTGLVVTSAQPAINTLGEYSSKYGIAILSSAAGAFFVVRGLLR